MTKKYLVVASLGLVLGLSACSAGVEKSGTDGASSSPVVASSPSEPAVVATTPSHTQSPSAVATSSASTGNSSQGSSETSSPDATEEKGALRAELSPAVTTELTCPDGTLNIDGTALSVEIVDDCDTVNVTGDISTILAQSVGTLNLDGNGSTVVMSTVGVVNLTEQSSINTVVWESGNPVVNDLSTASVVVSESRLP
ncbi:MAG: hypothetical protein KC561_15725 [Myxococcales bacterium]|nr:hypothetical protein [Myxococcales bacterium]